MDKDKFADMLLDAGWRNTADAQYSGIYRLYDELFPVVSHNCDNELTIAVSALTGDGIQELKQFLRKNIHK